MTTEDENRPRLLLVAEDAATYAEVRTQLTDVREVVLGTAVYDEATIVGAEAWRVFVPVSLDRPEDARRALLDTKVDLVVLVAPFDTASVSPLDVLVVVPRQIDRWRVDPRRSGVTAGDRFGSTTLIQPEGLAPRITAVLNRGEWRKRFQAKDISVGRDTAGFQEGTLFSTLIREATELELPSLVTELFHLYRVPRTSVVLAMIDIVRDVVAGWKPARLSHRPSPLPPVIAPPLHEYDGYLRGFSLRGIRSLPDVEWDLDDPTPGWHVVLGDNAAGKSTLLKALSLALLEDREREKLGEAWSGWLLPEVTRGEVHLSVVDGDNDTPVELSFTRMPAREHGATTVLPGSAQGLRFAGFAASYGPFRRFSGGDAEWSDTFREAPRVQRHLSLFDERAVLSDALEWLRDLHYRKLAQPGGPEDSLLASLERFLNTTEFLPEGTTFARVNPEGVWFRTPEGNEVRAQSLSDGHRAALSLALDLLRHLAAHVGPAALFEPDEPTRVAARGIVLIDEVDAHLHPTWQQRIGRWFTERFPRVQFIVATHSPIVCQSADSVLLLPTPGTGVPVRMATEIELARLRYGDVLEAYGTGVFGQGVTRSPEGREMLQRLAELDVAAMHGALSEEEQTEQRGLRRVLGITGMILPAEASP